MNLMAQEFKAHFELQQALGQLRLGGVAAVLETRLRQAQAEAIGARL